MHTIFKAIFWASLVTFIGLGAVVVFGQLLGVLAGQGSWVKGVNSALSGWAFSTSTLCAAAALALHYFRRDEDPAATPGED